MNSVDEDFDEHTVACPCADVTEVTPHGQNDAADTVAAGGCPKAAKRGSEKTELSFTAFRMEEKKYKLYKEVKPKKGPRVEGCGVDLTDVVDFRNMERCSLGNQGMMRKVEGLANDGPDCYTFSGVPGLLFFPNAVSQDMQAHWCQAALEEYTKSDVYPNNITTLKPEVQTSQYEVGLRWSTLGFKYNWTTRQYDRSLYAPFPRDLNTFMCQLVHRVAAVTQDQFCVLGEYQSQTAIVNFYPVGSMMMAHQDVSEDCLQKPLMSMSLGCSCIFLMGTESRDDKPYAFLLRSGDVVAFTGAARTAYHAVPRILDDCPQEMISGEEQWRRLMPSLRININVRQVYDERCDFLFE